ncbi:MAG: hypothetical protein MUC77_22025 [Chromatiaceae bacterium]|jgi:hypothetical protein|nr:hypothetical protein [Chromatiaceae bacterium]
MTEVLATTTNTLQDFPPESFTLLAFCEACGHSAAVDRSRLPPGLSTQSLASHLRCHECGARAAAIRIVYTGAGGFHVGAHYGGSQEGDAADRSPPLTD